MARMSMKEFESPDNQMVIRDKLIAIMKKYRTSLSSMENRMKISKSTLHRFCKEEKDVDFRSLSIIEAFVNKEEARKEDV